MTKSISILILILFFLSCAPRITPPSLELEPPDQWSSPAPVEAGDMSNWWVRFGDDGLTRLVEAALENNWDLKAAGSRVVASAALARISGADLLPQVTGSLSGSRQKRNFLGFPIPGAESGVLSSTSNLYNASLNVSWEIDLWSRLRAGQAAALLDLGTAQADRDGFRLSLVGQTVKAWFAAVEASLQISLTSATVANYLATNRQVWSRYRLGLTPSLDVRLSESNVANQEALLIQQRNQLQSLLRLLETLAGSYPRSRIQLSDRLPQLLEPVPAGLPAELLGRRPDLIAAERRLGASAARVAESRRALYPRISLTGAAGTSSDELKNILNGDFSVWNLVSNILQPLFQGGRLRAGVDLAQAREAEALAAYTQNIVVAFAEVETALAAEGYLREQEEKLIQTVEQAVAARDLAEDRYARGLVDLIAVLEAQRRAFVSQSQLLVVQRAQLDNRIDLYMALGGGFVSGEHMTEEKRNDS
jgi:multidrug efflux system outer membrane protein